MKACDVLRNVSLYKGVLFVDGNDLRLEFSGYFPPLLIEEIKQHKAEILAIKKNTPPPLPPLPKSVKAALSFLKRVKFERDITPKMHDWLDKEDEEIEAYEKMLEERMKWD